MDFSKIAERLAAAGSPEEAARMLKEELRTLLPQLITVDLPRSAADNAPQDAQALIDNACAALKGLCSAVSREQWDECLCCQAHRLSAFVSIMPTNFAAFRHWRHRQNLEELLEGLADIINPDEDEPETEEETSDAEEGDASFDEEDASFDEEEPSSDFACLIPALEEARQKYAALMGAVHKHSPSARQLRIKIFGDEQDSQALLEEIAALVLERVGERQSRLAEERNWPPDQSGKHGFNPPAGLHEVPVDKAARTTDLDSLPPVIRALVSSIIGQGTLVMLIPIPCGPSDSMAN